MLYSYYPHGTGKGVNMDKVEIPLFVKNMGHKIIGYILNVNDEEAKVILGGEKTLEKDQREILDAYINICRQLRFQGFDQSDIDFSLFLGLPNIIQNGQHIFNIWHEQMGGTKPKIAEEDKVIHNLSKIALELYPLFLIKVPQDNWLFAQMYSHLTPAIFRLPEHNQLLKDIANDKSLIKMFSTIGKSEMETSGYFTTSNGRGASIQLSMLPSLIIINAYLLMRLRGSLSEETFTVAITEMVEILRSVAEGQAVELPVLFGFHNIALDNSGILETALGTIRPYDEGLLELIPPQSKPSTLGGENKLIGIVLEAKYKFKVDFNANPENFKPPIEFEHVRKKLDNLREDLSLSFALCIDREPPVGIIPAWTLLFDPLSPGLSISWNNRVNTPMDYYLCKSEDRERITNWCNILKKTDDSKIRIAIRRVLSALNERTNPIDGFIDSVISWENLFGGPTELKFRISVAIARLLGSTEAERFELQSKVNKLYDNRSEIVHGDKEISYQEAVQKRNECLNIAIHCLRTLYQSRVDLINDSDRSKKLLLE